MPPHGSTGGYSTVRDDRYATGEGVANGVSWSRKGFGKKSGAARGGYADRLEVQVSRSEVRRFLSDEKIASSSRTARTGNLDLQQDDLIRLRVEATVKRRSGEMRLVVGPNSDRASVITPILAGVARLHLARGGISGRTSKSHHDGENA